MSQSATQVHREALQRQTQQDWANREYIELISGSIKRIADFLNAFDMSCRSRLSSVNEKLTALERKVDYLEARVAGGRAGGGQEGVAEGMPPTAAESHA